MIPPHSLEAEKALLGAILVHGDRLADAAPLVGEADFYRDAHRRIFVKMLAIGSARPASVDFVTLAAALKQAGDLDEIGGPAYLAGLTDGTPMGANVQHYAGIVRDLAQKRRLMAAAVQMLERGGSADADAATLLDEAERAIFGIADHAQRGAFVGGEALSLEHFALLQRRAEGTEPAGLMSGWDALDAMTQGFKPGELILVAARPSMGKSAVAHNLAWRAALTGVTVGLYSLEMSRQSVTDRIIAAATGVDLHRIKSGRLFEKDYGRVTQAHADLSVAPLYIDDTPGITAMEVRSKARRLKAQHGLGLVIVDYLQLMATGKAENRNLAIGELSWSLKLMARELECPVIALSQLSRELERRSEKRPMLSDLRDSGALEQDADVIVFVHRPEVYAETPDNHGVAELIVGKQRNGPTGLVTLAWRPDVTRFDNAA